MFNTLPHQAVEAPRRIDDTTGGGNGVAVFGS